MHYFHVLVPLLAFNLTNLKTNTKLYLDSTFTKFEFEYAYTFLFLSLSSINGTIEVPNDFEFTYEIARLNFPCRIKKKLHKNCRVFVSMVTAILLYGRTSIILRETSNL